MVHYSSRKWPIVLGVTLVALVVALLVIWIVNQASSGQWGMLILGAIFFTLTLVGVVVYFVLTIKEVNLSRRQANFIDSVTHELKSPIASIKLYLQTLDMRDVDLDQQRKFHRFMLDDVQRLDELIDHLLVAAQLNHQEEEKEPPQDIDLGECLTECVEIVARRYDLAEEKIDLDLPPSVVHAYRRDLEMIFGNLLDNAAKYAGDDPQLHIQVRRQGKDRVSIRITDNGRGIRFELRRKIFQRFFRGGTELVRTTKGTGLGLYLVRSLVKKNKGKISVNNRGPLSGATFEVELPGRMLDAETPLKSQSQPHSVATLSSARTSPTDPS